MEKKAQARKEFGKTCEAPKDAPEHVKQVKANRAHPDLINKIRADHYRTRVAVEAMQAKPMLKDSGS